MALRNIVKEGDAVLSKKCRPVEKIDDKIITLLDDMAETMYANDGVGLAAPQIGILKRIAVIDIGDGLIELINPVITETKGEQREVEGCLSVPGVSGYTVRPMTVTVTALDREGNEVIYQGSELLARAFCHEIDHLDGVLFREKVFEYCE